MISQMILKRKRGIDDPEVIDIVSITPDRSVVELHMVQTSKWTGSAGGPLVAKDGGEFVLRVR